VQGVIVLALRAPAVVVEEKRLAAEAAAEEDAKRQEVWRQMLEQQRQQRQEHAVRVIQRSARVMLRHKKAGKTLHQKATVSRLPSLN
jgi:hypothetical protein